MIFATTGTHAQPMPRLVDWLEDWAAQHGERVVLQTMTCREAPRAVERVVCVEPERWEALIREARVVVSHAGPASIFEIQALGKTPVVIPRSHTLGEHVDDHQVRYAASLGPQVPTVATREELWAHLQNPPPRPEPVATCAMQRAACQAARETTYGLVQTTHHGWAAGVLRALFWR